MAADSFIEVSRDLDQRRAIIRLNRPSARNALNGPLLDQLDQALDDLSAGESARAIVLTGSDTCFCAGADLKEDVPDRVGRIARMHRLVERLDSYPAVTIAAIEGWALGGGLELAMACTFRVAAPGALLGLPEVGLGVIPAYGGTQLASRLLGSAAALELLCFGEPVGAEKAERIGLVNWVAAERGGSLALALDRAKLLVGQAPEAIAAARLAVRLGQKLQLAEGLRIEREVITALLASATPPDAKAAFQFRNAPPA